LIFGELQQEDIMSDNGVGHRSGARMTTAHNRVLALLCVLLGPVPIVAAQDCKVSAAVTRETSVYARPATEFNTANGWVYGSPVAVLGAKVRVFVCAQRTVRFGVISQSWTQIAYWSSGKWQHGWVVSDNIQQAVVDQPSAWVTSLPQLILLVSSARAQPPVITESPPADARAAPPPPKTSSPGGAANADASALANFYVVLFVCMVLGMGAKIFFDTLLDQKGVNLKARIRAGLLPILVSPIVFLGIMQGADVTAAATLTSFVALACSAFQNGFFWHTILDRAR